MLSIVLLPGMDGTGTLFDPFIAALGPGFNLVTVRYPTQDGLGYAELENIARGFLPKHGNFIILGESFSGPIAVSLASSRPDGLMGLVLCSTFVRNPRPVFSPARIVLGLLPVKLAPDFLYNYFLLGASATLPLKASLKAAVSQVSASAFRARMHAVLCVDVSSKMKSIQVPVLYFQAAKDRLVPSEAGAFIKRIYPATQLQSIDAPHFLLQVAPEQAAALVKQFVSDIQHA